ALDIAQRVIAVRDGVAQIGQAMRDAVELPLCLADHLSRLIELRRRGRGFARARDGIQLRLIALLELAILIEPAAHVALTALLRVHRLTSPIERRRGAFTLPSTISFARSSPPASPRSSSRTSIVSSSNAPAISPIVASAPSATSSVKIVRYA